MKKLQFLIIVSNTSRALVYLKAIKRNKLIPNEIIYLDDEKKNVFKNRLYKLFIQLPKIKVKKFEGIKINKKISDYLLKKKEKCIVYSGYPGILVKNRIIKKKYEIPKKISDIDSDYDNLIRSKNLIYVLKNFYKLKKKRQTKNYKIPYFVIHPLLRSKVLMKKNKWKN